MTALLEIGDLAKRFELGNKRLLHAVDTVSFEPSLPSLRATTSTPTGTSRVSMCALSLKRSASSVCSIAIISFGVASAFSALALMSHLRDVAHDGPPNSSKSFNSYALRTRFLSGAFVAVRRPAPLGKISGMADKGLAASGLLGFIAATSKAGAAVAWPWTCEAPCRAVAE